MNEGASSVGVQKPIVPILTGSVIRIIFNYMVEHPLQLDRIFHSLSDPTRRDILQRVTHKEMTISQLADLYDVTFAGVSKHLMVLEDAQLISKRKEGRSVIVSLEARTLKQADAYLERYRRMWEGRYKKLDFLLK